MSKLSKQRAKEMFLSNVEGVSRDTVLDIVKSADGEDLYTYVVKSGAWNSGTLDDKDINEFVLRYYSDWYFLHKNTYNKDIKAVKLLSEGRYAPVNLVGDSCFELIKGGEYAETLPISFQYINRLEDKYFICVKTDVLYNRHYKNSGRECRLYINLKCSSLLEFAKEFLDRAYTVEFPAVLKILNNDERFDTVTIYTDYEYVQTIIDMINLMRKECSSIFKDAIGELSPMLGVVDDYIGFGEQSSMGHTYLMSRCMAFSSLQNIAGLKLLRDGIVGEEKKIIARSDGSTYTPTEYLHYLIEKNAVKLVESKIEELESAGIESGEEINKLYAMREDIVSSLNMTEEVGKLKKSLTRNEKYTLKINDVGEDDFDYESKLYRLFSTEDDRILGRHAGMGKKDLISSNIFTLTESFQGVDTKEFLNQYFKGKLAVVIKNVIEEELLSVKRNKTSNIIQELKKKACAKLRSILSSLLDDSDEGRVYIGRAVNDYIRILSTDSSDNVEITIDGRTISLDDDVNVDIVSLLPSLQEEINNMSLNSDYIDNILAEFDINKENICINKITKNIRKEPIKKQTVEQSHYYYNPEGYLTKSNYESEYGLF